MLRRRLRAALAASVAAVACAGAIAAPPAAPVASDAAAIVHQRLQLSPVLKGEFEQTKTLKGFRNALVSHGEFLVARGQGVWWHTLKPFESTLVVTPTRLFTRAADGGANDVMDAGADAGLRQVNELVFSLLAGDVGALADRFDATAQAVGSSGWSLVLVPKDPRVAGVLLRATLTGDRQVETVRIDEARGDTTQIRFSHQAPSATLAADDAARLR